MGAYALKYVKVIQELNDVMLIGEVDFEAPPNISWQIRPKDPLSLLRQEVWGESRLNSVYAMGPKSDLSRR
jgi:hypothetical protein